jgi:hypothetical protein
MDAGTLRHAINELTRAGCRVEQVAHAGGVVVFADARGDRWYLAFSDDGCRIAREGTRRSSLHPTVADAMRMAAAQAV